MLDLSKIFDTFPVLETGRCVLRSMTVDDSADILGIYGDPKVTRYLARPAMDSLDKAVSYIENCQATFQRQEGIAWGICLRDGGKLIGTCVYWHFMPEHDRAEVGYSIASDYWGQGFATDAISAELVFGFNHMGLHSVEALIDPANNGSRRVLEKLGFVQEGYFHENYFDPIIGQYTDTAVFSLIKSAWMARTKGNK